VIARGTEAERLLAARGLRTTGDVHTSWDEVDAGAVRVARIWHTPASGTLKASSGRALVIVQLDGSIALDAREGTARRGGLLRAGQVLLVTAGADVALDASESTARIEIEARLPLLALRPQLLSAQDRDGAWAKAALVSLANAALNAGLADGSPGLEHFAAAIGSCCTALVHELFPDAIGTTTVGERAIAVIERDASDPALSVSRLAERLGVTRQHLAFVFAQEGRRTPLQEIRRARAVLAREQLIAGRRSPLRDIARVSGFGSEDALRRALREA